MSDIYTTLLARIPEGTKAGREKVIRNTITACFGLQHAMDVAAKRDDLAPKGRAAMLDPHVKIAATALTKARRQTEHHRNIIAQWRQTVEKNAIGPEKSTDCEYRTYLRSLSTADRVQQILTNPAARAAALREPGLSGLDEVMIAQALAITLEQNAKAEMQALATEEEAQKILTIATSQLSKEIMSIPFVVDNSSVRAFESLREMEGWIEKNVPAPQPKTIILEEAEIEQVDEAA